MEILNKTLVIKHKGVYNGLVTCSSKKKNILKPSSSELPDCLLMILNPTGRKSGRLTNEKDNPIPHSLWGREREIKIQSCTVEDCAANSVLSPWKNKFIKHMKRTHNTWSALVFIYRNSVMKLLQTVIQQATHLRKTDNNQIHWFLHFWPSSGILNSTTQPGPLSVCM
jgi:hypothetical protein